MKRGEETLPNVTLREETELEPGSLYSGFQVIATIECYCPTPHSWWTRKASNQVSSSPLRSPAGPGRVSKDRYEKALLSEDHLRQEIQQLAWPLKRGPSPVFPPLTPFCAFYTHTCWGKEHAHTYTHSLAVATSAVSFSWVSKNSRYHVANPSRYFPNNALRTLVVIHRSGDSSDCRSTEWF